jgi:hypothetical protein
MRQSTSHSRAEPTVNRPNPPVPHCRACVHYYITHDARFPYGCRAMDFKSKRLPLQDVREATGRDCQLFQARASGNLGRVIRPQ